jgi:hypothetical protein
MTANYYLGKWAGYNRSTQPSNYDVASVGPSPGSFGVLFVLALMFTVFNHNFFTGLTISPEGT